MPLLTRRRVILVKSQTEANVDASPTPEANAIWCLTSSNISPSGDEQTRDLIRDTLTPIGNTVTGKTVKFDLAVELRGGGLSSEVATFPEIDPLYRACGMTRGDDTGVFTYTPDSAPANHTPCTIYWYDDGRLHKALDCKGDWSMDLQEGKTGQIKFSMQGVWVDPVDAELPAPTLLELDPPVINGLTLTIGGYSPIATALSLSLGNKVAARKDLRAADSVLGFVISGRSPSGSLDPEATVFSEFDPWSAWSAGTKAALSVGIGTADGNTINISCPAVQYTTPSYGDRDGIRTYDLSFVLTGSSDNEISIAYS